MNRITAFGLVFLLIIIALGVWMFETPRAVSPLDTVATSTATTSAQTSPIPTTAKPTTSAPTPATNTFKSIFTQTGSHECKYDQVASTGQKHNVVYIADGKMRGEFRTTGGGTSAGDLMVYNGGYLYVWKEGKSTGTKTQISSISQLPYAIPTDLTSGAVLGTNGNNVSWDCHNWIKDSTLLTPPSYVTFSAR